MGDKLKTDRVLRAQIGSRMKRARENLKIGVGNAARSLEVSGTSVLQWESGRSFPTVEHLKAMVSLYRVSADALLCRTSPEEFAQELFLAVLRGLDPR